MRDWKVLIWIIVIFAGCRKPYNPPAIASPNSYLVVEGVINSGNDSTIIKLSKTVKLSSKNAINPVLKAVLTVESDQNNSYPLIETSNGYYVANALNLDNSHKYRLRIKTADNLQYISDFVAVENSPPIDTVGFEIQRNDSTQGVQIYSGTHDPKNNTRYYRYDYTETWIIHSTYESYYKSNGDTVLRRNFATDNVYTCWRTDTSSTIVLASSAKLSTDVIYQNPITHIASTSEKISDEYSILLRQYALTADAYTFWTNLKKSTEQLGSIFDAEPTQINGNIHSLTNPAEVVIGYVSVGSVSSKRIFISTRQLPTWLPLPYSPECELDTELYAFVPPGSHSPPINEVNETINYLLGAGFQALIPVNAIQPNGDPKIEGYSASSPICVDCTLRGTNVEPSYWKY